jgi:hypothetical protein
MLDTQRAALAASCEAYDGGRRWEALRVAVSVYTIVHDSGRNNKSLLTQAGIKDRLSFICSGQYVDGKNLGRDAPLVSIKIYGDGTAEYIPISESGFPTVSRAVPFQEWWERDKIFAEGQARFSLTRKRLTFNLRSKEGGAHYDSVIEDPNYLRFAHSQITAPHIGRADQLRPLLGAEFATMRQIGSELIQTLAAI